MARLPTLAPHLTLRIPEPVALGRPAGSYPFSWAIYRWIDGRPYADKFVDDEARAARDIAQVVLELRRVDPVADLLRPNNLVDRGRLSAVIDFGGLGVGDPATDVIAAWSVFHRRGRSVFREALDVDCAGAD